jgi:hypothetical protein
VAVDINRDAVDALADDLNARGVSVLSQRADQLHRRITYWDAYIDYQISREPRLNSEQKGEYRWQTPGPRVLRL